MGELHLMFPHTKDIKDMQPDNNHTNELEADIYSLEHQENVEEFNTKDIPSIFLHSLKEKKMLPEGKDPLIVDSTLPEEEEEVISPDSVSCTVEESDLNCPPEDLDSEFTDEDDRESGLNLPLEKEKINVPMC